VTRISGFDDFFAALFLADPLALERLTVLGRFADFFVGVRLAVDPARFFVWLRGPLLLPAGLELDFFREELPLLFPREAAPRFALEPPLLLELPLRFVARAAMRRLLEGRDEFIVTEHSKNWTHP
jgi:hypothetical protein